MIRDISLVMITAAIVATGFLVFEQDEPPRFNSQSETCSKTK